MTGPTLEAPGKKLKWEVRLYDYDEVGVSAPQAMLYLIGILLICFGSFTGGALILCDTKILEL